MSSAPRRWWHWWHRLVPPWLVSYPHSEDVAMDNGIAGSRAHGGPRPKGPTSDSATTTGTTDNGSFVGRAAGDDLGYAETTGAEVRPASDNQQPGSDDAPDDAE